MQHESHGLVTLIFNGSSLTLVKGKSNLELKILYFLGDQRVLSGIYVRCEIQSTGDE